MTIFFTPCGTALPQAAIGVPSLQILNRYTSDPIKHFESLHC